IFAKENNNKVIFRVKKEGVTLTTDSTQYGEGEVTLSAPVEGVATEIALNSQYILEALNNWEGGVVSFAISEKTSPVVLKSPQQADYLHIIMPLKI
ncbi:MAG: hypothetical protein V1760_03295, partial [Candidatus Peregrinibacteria bacterium]